MSSEPTFLELLLRGKVAADEIDDFIDRWHEAPAGQELPEYLGMTEQEYARWVRRPDSLAEIVKSRRTSTKLRSAHQR